MRNGPTTSSASLSSRGAAAVRLRSRRAASSRVRSRRRRGVRRVTARSRASNSRGENVFGR